MTGPYEKFRTDQKRIAMIELSGLLECVILKVAQVREAHELSDDIDDEWIVERMAKAQAAITRMREVCLSRTI